MDACKNIEGHIDKILSKFESFSNSYEMSLSELCEHIVTLQRELLTGPDVEQDGDLSVMAVMMWEKALEQLRKILGQMGTEHREMHGGISKCGREIDRNFVSSFSGICQKVQNYETDPVLKSQVNSLIMQHLLTKGLFDIAEQFSEECDAKMDDSNKELYLEINTVLTSLKEHNVDPALEWSKTHREKLRSLDSSLEFNLHKLKFIEMLNRGVTDQWEALSYARVFQDFAEKHAQDIQVLMGALLFLRKGLSDSPYRSLLDPILWVQLCDLFAKEACSLLGLPSKSPLSVILNAGTIAVPALLNIRQIMQQRQVMGMWSHNDELPIEIDLGNENRYHSIFSCPILRQQTTDKNPPMRLSCGHAISKEALHKLASNNKLKCPYCPQESNVSDAKQLYF